VGGEHLGWTSEPGVGLLAAGLVLACVFVLVEQRAAESIPPMRLFSNSIFSIANTFGFLIGVAMFGSLILIPVHLQVVDGMTPTESGIAMLPMVAGLFSTSIAAGLIMTRTGRYKIFPILGATVVICALVMFSMLNADSPYWNTALTTST
jgi:predicted MFS family arabinose efflux permease